MFSPSTGEEWNRVCLLSCIVCIMCIDRSDNAGPLRMDASKQARRNMRWKGVCKLLLGWLTASANATDRLTIASCTWDGNQVLSGAVAVKLEKCGLGSMQHIGKKVGEEKKGSTGVSRVLFPLGSACWGCHWPSPIVKAICSLGRAEPLPSAAAVIVIQANRAAATGGPIVLRICVVGVGLDCDQWAAVVDRR
ncbi:hypothetical protein BJ170DRAFT_43040 [Xylariales sp. AK1849]|nr:hypothetical protein BJ170DRAFT_43040 [Xylariales sp. AK1849]